ncbi:MAG TPA: hypothetical protein VHT70_03730 [Candidatus Saccharimonadales bacterium]|jgi:hypothetical protein|nr:hypothetical protein [Candidatus Saccharimonadales bacterium]
MTNSETSDFAEWEKGLEPSITGIGKSRADMTNAELDEHIKHFEGVLLGIELDEASSGVTTPEDGAEEARLVAEYQDSLDALYHPPRHYYGDEE